MWVSQRSRMSGRDSERRMPHPQPGVAPLLAVRRRAAPVLLQEHPQPLLGRTEVVLRVQRAQRCVVGDAGVEAPDQGHEGLVTADLVVERGDGAGLDIAPIVSGGQRRLAGWDAL